MNTRMNAKGDNTLALVALGGLILFALTKLKPGNEEPPPVSSGPLKLGATINQIDLSQSSAVSMGSHLLRRTIGETITVNVRWTPQTTNEQGEVFPWLYRFRTELGHDTTWGWKNAKELTGGDGEVFKTITGVTGQELESEVAAVSTPNDDDQKWDVQVKVYAAKANESGQILVNEWQEMDFVKHEDALWSFAHGVFIGATINSVDVRQPDYNPAFRTAYNPGFGQGGRRFHQYPDFMDLLKR